MTQQVQATIPTPWGDFEVTAWSESTQEPMPHLMLMRANSNLDKPVLVRIHSECLTGDIFGSKRCDCGEQLHAALQQIGQEGGIILYLRQEGRGIGLINKLKAYNLQDAGDNTAEANIHLGYQVDERDYTLAVQMLGHLSVKSIRLLTNNPQKIEAIAQSPIEVVQRVPLIIPSHSENEDYLKTKKEIMGHLL